MLWVDTFGFGTMDNTVVAFAKVAGAVDLLAS